MTSSTSNQTIVYQSQTFPQGEPQENTIIQPNSLPTDIWSVIFKYLDLQTWKNLSLISRSFKLICEDSTIMHGLWEKKNCIPDNKRLNFVIKMGTHLKKLKWDSIPLTEQELTKILETCTNLEEFSYSILTLAPIPIKSGLMTSMKQKVSSWITPFWKKEGTTAGQETMAMTAKKYDKLKTLSFSIPPSFSEQKSTEILTACSNLTNLSLRYCQLTEEILKHLPPSLQFLVIDTCNITDDNLALLKPLINLTDLRLIFCTQITDNGIKYLKELRSLNKLHLIGCSKTTKTGHESLKPIVVDTGKLIFGTHKDKANQ